MGRHTRVVCSTFASRGKSLTPESRIDILEDKSAFDERRDETQEAREFAIAKISFQKALERRSRSSLSVYCTYNKYLTLERNKQPSIDGGTNQRSAHPAL